MRKSLWANPPARRVLRAGVVGTHMAKFLYSAAMSLDGFIAGPGGDVSWMADHLGPNPVVDQLIAQTGAILVGNRTFGGDDPYQGQEGEGEVFGGGWDGPQIVLTHRPPDERRPGVTFVGDIETAISESRVAAGDKYVNVLGASVAAQCLAAGVLDEVLVSVTPVFLGDGTRLFEHPGGKTVRLKQINVSHTRQITNLWYRIAV
ncbi:dihydrofolate reductase family protein [Mycobacterium sp.]|uniref:dihydrofolate reductase family protein n=1 Tax=Mycobacterium sp. TaxID=1785 RepID=UPI002BFDB9E1|nr:dihydrofolate reductase family protein [Mycobacterium sp.]HTH91545.1 dihydrofolate reductase family protein [Mycobacterium sp.]